MTELWNYTKPVYDRVLLFAFMHRVDWKFARGKDPEVFVRQQLRSIDLGAMSGKTTAVCKFAEDHDGCIIICQTAEYAGRIQRRTGQRAWGVDEVKKFKSDRFTSTDPMFIFDDVSLRQTLEVVSQFKPTRFIHVGTV